jgi:hypothetical protein
MGKQWFPDRYREISRVIVPDPLPRPRYLIEIYKVVWESKLEFVYDLSSV